MRVSAFWPDPDGLCRERWDFSLGGGIGGLSLTLVGYSIERRSKPKGRFRAATREDRWLASDERSYVSGLPRPDEVSYERAIDALMDAEIPVYLGWPNSEQYQFTIKIKDAE